MSDVEAPHDGEEADQPSPVDEQVIDDGGLVIIPGGADVDVSDTDEPIEASVESPSEVGDEIETPGAAEPQFTLDELVAEMAGVSSVVASATSAAEPPVVTRVDVLADAMSDAFAEAPPVEMEMWTRAPFWVGGGSWAVFVGVLTYLLWPSVGGGLQSDPLYGVFVYGGTGLVVFGLIVGLWVWSRARARAANADRAIVGRAIMLRALGWTAVGVMVWVIALIVLSLHSLDVIP